MSMRTRQTEAAISPHSPRVHDGGMTQTERTKMIVFALGMFMSAGLSIWAVLSGAHKLQPRDRSRAQTLTLLAPAVLSVVSLAIFPWSAIF